MFQEVRINVLFHPIYKQVKITPLILTICKLPTGHSSRSPFVGPEALKTSGWIWPGTTWPVAKNPPRRSASRCLGGSTSGYT